MKRDCSVCGKELDINLRKDKSYFGGNYFGKVEIPFGKGKYIKTGKTKINKKIIDVVKWDGKEKEIEYWECDKCFKED